MDRLSEHDQVVDPFTPLENMFNHFRTFFFIQTEPFVQKDEEPKCLDETVMIFFKHDGNSNSITFFGCSYFQAIDSISKVYDYVRKELHLNDDVPLIVYREGGRGIILPDDQLIYATVTDNEEIGSAPVTLILEIGGNRRFQYDVIVER